MTCNRVLGNWYERKEEVSTTVKRTFLNTIKTIQSSKSKKSYSLEHNVMNEIAKNLFSLQNRKKLTLIRTV